MSDDLTGAWVPDIPEPIRGFRVWGTDGTRLMSHNNTPWPWEVPLEAECIHPSAPWVAPAPCDTCPCAPKDGAGHVGDKGCGIYAADSFDHLAEVYGIQVGPSGLPFAHTPTTYIIGEVEVWGRYFEYTKGVRAQFAQPVVIYDNGRKEVAELARRYGCEVRPFDAERFREAADLAHKRAIAWAKWRATWEKARIRARNICAFASGTALWSFVTSLLMDDVVAKVALGALAALMGWVSVDNYRRFRDG